jgi:hypothetical protein
MFYVVTSFLCGRTSILWAYLDRILVHNDIWSSKMQILM